MMIIDAIIDTTIIIASLRCRFSLMAAYNGCR